MRRRGLALLALTAAAAALAVLAQAKRPLSTRPAPWATLAFARSEIVGGGIVLLGGGQVRTELPGGVEPAWSPDGRRLAYIAAGAGGAGDLFVADADGTRRGRITTTEAHEASPTWAPDGARLALEADGMIVIQRADGSGGRKLARGRLPAWSPGGRRIAFERDGDLFAVAARGGRARPLGARAPGIQTEPAWAPNARRLVYVSDETGFPDLRVLDLRTGRSTALTADEAVETSPAFSNDGRFVVFASNRDGVEGLWRLPAEGGAPLAVPSLPFAAHPRPRPRPEVAELPPDFDQQPPSELGVRPSGGGFRLWFTSAADNVGLGPFIVNGRRGGRGAGMRAHQRVRLANGSLRTHADVGVWRYNASSDHSHWHLLDFQRYELRRADGRVVVRDRKSGFCIGDRYGVAPGAVTGRTRTPVFRGFCNLYQPGALEVDAGTSVGFSDRYHSRLDGQNVNLTRVPAGRYVLVNRANPTMEIREVRYENNAASVAIRVTWPGGRRRAPNVKILAVCPGSERC